LDVNSEEILDPYPVLVTLSLSLLSKAMENVTGKAKVKRMCDMHQWPSVKVSDPLQLHFTCWVPALMSQFSQLSFVK
jgi:hypothetical protein